jgi:hypothetical protein
VILLDPSIQIGAAAMLDLRTTDLADRTRIRIVAIARLARNRSDSGDSTTKESLGSRHVARLTEHRVDQNTDLMTKRDDLELKRCPTPEYIEDRPQER